MYTTIGSLDHPEECALVKQCGIESRLAWVKFCEDVPGERTAESAARAGIPGENAATTNGR